MNTTTFPTKTQAKISPYIIPYYGISLYGGCHLKEKYNREILQNLEHPFILLEYKSQLLGHIKLQGNSTFLSYTNKYNLDIGGVYCLHPTIRFLFESHLEISNKEEKRKKITSIVGHAREFRVSKIRIDEYTPLPFRKIGSINPKLYGIQSSFKHDLESFLDIISDIPIPTVENYFDTLYSKNRQLAQLGEKHSQIL